MCACVGANFQNGKFFVSGNDLSETMRRFSDAREKFTLNGPLYDIFPSEYIGKADASERKVYGGFELSWLVCVRAARGAALVSVGLVERVIVFCVWVMLVERKATRERVDL